MPPPTMRNPTAPGLKREIGQLGFAAVALNGSIGGGIFALPAVAAAQTGSFSPWLFLIAGASFMTIVLSFAKLSRLYSRTGGPSVYVGESLGPFLGFQTGWLLYLGRVTALAANANLAVTYLAWFVPAANTTAPRAALIAVVIGGLTAVNLVGVRQGIRTMLVLTVMKLGPLLLLLLVGLPHLSSTIERDASWPSPATIGETLLVLFYAFIGFEGGVVNAGEGRQPRRDIPLAIVRAVSFTALLYFSIQWLAVSVVPALGRSERPLADAAEVVLGAWGAELIVITAVVSILGNLSSILIAAPRMTFALARDRTLPMWFATVHPRYGTPANSIAIVGLLGLLLATSNTFVYLATMSALVRLVGYVLCIASLPKLERRAARGMRARSPWLRHVTPALALLLCVSVMSFASRQAWLTLSAFSGVGALLYGLTRRRIERFENRR